MKQILIIALLLCSIGAAAQINQPAPVDTVFTLKLKKSELLTNQALLKFLYDNVRTSNKTSAAEAEQVRTTIEQFFPLLKPEPIIADKPKTPIKK